MIVLNKFKLKEIIVKRKIDTYSKLGKLLGISKNQLSNILSNKFSPIKSNIVELCKFLNISPLELLQEEKSNDKI